MATRLPDRLCECLSVLKRRARGQRRPALALLPLLLLLLLLLLLALR
jgi:hypothetical protein